MAATYGVRFAGHVERAPLELAKMLEEYKNEGGGVHCGLLRRYLIKSSLSMAQRELYTGESYARRSRHGRRMKIQRRLVGQ